MSFETARGIVHAWQCDHMGHANLTPSRFRTESVRMAGVQQNISYKRELLPGDLVLVRSRLAEISERKLRMEHELVNAESNEVCATCELTAVCIDASTRKPRPFPADVASRAQEFLKGNANAG